MKRFLVVIDVQNDFITGALRNEEAINQIPNIVKKIREFDGDVIYVTQDTHQENYLETKEGKSLPVVHCVTGTEGWKLEPNVEAALDDAELRGIKVKYIVKPTFGSLSLARTMEADLRESKEVIGTADVEMVGFVSSICVISNALLLKAKLYENIDLTVDAKCTAGLSEENNKAALEVMKSCQVKVINE